MKIATNVHRDAFGGITISNLALFDWLEDKDDSIVGIEYLLSRHVLGAVIFRRYQPSFFRHHIINGIDVIPKRSWERPGNLRKNWDVMIEATKSVLRTESPDVILANGTYFAPWILTRAARELGIPIVLRYAGVLQREIQRKPWLVRRRLLRHEQWIDESADAVIFPSDVCRDVVEREVLGHPVARSVVIPNPAKAGTVRPRGPHARFTIAAIGRWTPIKNFEAFVALHEHLRNMRWPHRAIMVTSYWDERFGISDTIERRDPMSQDDLRSFYRSIDLLVVPSHFETFSNVAAEALVNGTSVLVSKHVGFSEILRRAGLGRMVIDSFDDPARTAAAVRRLARTRLTGRERASVVRLLDPQEIHQDILNVLESVLDTDGGTTKEKTGRKESARSEGGGLARARHA